MVAEAAWFRTAGVNKRRARPFLRCAVNRANHTYLTARSARASFGPLGAIRDGAALTDSTALRQPQLEELHRLHETALLARARRLCRNDADASDLVQDTFERAFRRIE